MTRGSITLKAVGDIGLNAGIGELLARRGAAHLFARTKDCLSGADILFGNLEMPLAPAGAAAAFPEVRERFRADPAHAEALSTAGFGLLSLANNHVMDFGVFGLRSTRDALRRAGIPHVGSGENLAQAREAVILTVRGVRVGVLAFAQQGRHSATATGPGAAPIVEAMIVEDLESLSSRVDIRVVSLHFGMVYSDYPSPDDRGLARRLTDAGADLILGHHPHVVQGMERRGRSLIAYSLGEFLFDPTCGHVVSRVAAQTRRQTMVLSVSLTSDGVTGYEVLPVLVEDDLRPAVLDGEDREQGTARIQELSAAAAGDDSTLFHEQLADRTVRHQRDVMLHHIRKGNLGILIPWLFRARPRHLFLLMRALLQRAFKR